MNRVVLLLAATTLTFTATAIYYAHALGVEKARQSPLRMRAANGQQIESALGAQATGATAVAEKTDTTDSGVKLDPGLTAIARHYLDQLRDPATRAERKKEMVGRYREDMASSTGMMGLSEEEFDRYVEALAERTLKNDQQLFECQLDPACDESALLQAMARAGISETRQMQAELLGPERHARYLAIREALQERNEVHEIRRQMTEPNAMTDAQADKLIAALAAERRKFAIETEQNGQELLRYTAIPGRGAGVFLQSGAIPGASDVPAQRVASATRYNQRILDLASGILTAGQLAEFRLMQEIRLQEYQEFMHEEEIREAARKAADSKP